MSTLALKSFAKLNLYLEILNKRKDNYHNIRTLFERIGLCDKIFLKTRPDKKINIICNNPLVPKDRTNLCYRAAKLLQDKFNIGQGLDIKIIKRIPVSAGLGGGSSNAATVILGLNKLWRLKLSQGRLIKIARSIGSDVPFFIYNTRFAKGEGRGDKIIVLRNLKDVNIWHVLVVPNIRVSTPFVYKKWDKFSPLTMPKYDVNILNLALKRKNLSLISGLLFNGLEDITSKLYPEVGLARWKLKDLGLESVLMSGSGPAVFGIVFSRKEAVSLNRRLRAKERSWKIYVTKTM